MPRIKNRVGNQYILEPDPRDFHSAFDRDYDPVIPDKKTDAELDVEIKNAPACSWCGSAELWQEYRWPTSFFCAKCYKEEGEKRQDNGECRLISTNLVNKVIIDPKTGSKLKAPWDLGAIQKDMAEEEQRQEAQKNSPSGFDLTELDKVFVGKGEYILEPKPKRETVRNPLSRKQEPEGGQEKGSTIRRPATANGRKVASKQEPLPTQPTAQPKTQEEAKKPQEIDPATPIQDQIFLWTGPGFSD